MSARFFGQAMLATTLLSLAGLAPAQTAQTSNTAGATPAAPGSQQSRQIERGEYLARAGDCMACHTVKGKAPFSGGLAMNTPFGTIYSTNITPDKQTGIGNYTAEEFAAALRKGKRRDGSRLYPAMPYTSFAKLSDEDTAALYAYFLQGVKPVQQDNPKTALPFPFNMRVLMAGWNMLFFDDKPYKVDSTQSIDWNRGAYLVQSLGHCGACHTPHGRLGQEQSLDGGSDSFLAGYTLDNWHAPSLRNDKDGLGRWNKEQIAAYLRTGRSDDGAAFGAMSQVINDSTQHLSNSDLLAIADYLSSLPGKKSANGAGKAPPATAASNAAGADQPATLELRSGKLQTAGAAVYLNNCNACHRSDGTGAMKAFPALGKNAVANVDDPTSLIHVVLAGSAMPSTKSDPTPMGMPGFGWRLNDREVAEVVSFVRGNWGNHGAPVSAEQVAAVRKAIQK